MSVCPHCRQTIPETPQSTPTSTILLWGGIGLAAGVLISCAGFFLIVMAVGMMGTKANQTFLTVGSSLTTSGSRP
jgi:hypothetical protein